jgi:hypothetical protein
MRRSRSLVCRVWFVSASWVGPGSWWLEPKAVGAARARESPVPVPIDGYSTQWDA